MEKHNGKPIYRFLYSQPDRSTWTTWYTDDLEIGTGDMNRGRELEGGCGDCNSIGVDGWMLVGWWWWYRLDRQQQLRLGQLVYSSSYIVET